MWSLKYICKRSVVFPAQLVVIHFDYGSLLGQWRMDGSDRLLCACLDLKRQCLLLGEILDALPFILRTFLR